MISARKLLLCACAALAPAAALAQQPTDDSGSAAAVLRPVLSAYTVDAGSAHVADTYLSPLRYSGFTAAFSYERMQAMRFNPERWVMQLHIRSEFARTLNPARNALIYELDIRGSWAMMARWQMPAPWLTLMAGGSTSADFGMFYCPRNGNNPASARAEWAVNATAAAVARFRIGRLPVVARYQAEMALAGVFFSPSYGELYYEISLGNHSRLAHAAWPGNFLRLNNYLTADLLFGATSLRLGYNNYIGSTAAAGIVTRRIVHCFTVGITSEWLALPLRSRSRMPAAADARVISALY